MSLMKTVGYIRVSTDKQADRGVSLDAQAEKIRAMAVVQGAELIDVIIDGGESAKSLNRPGMARLLALVDSGDVKTSRSWIGSPEAPRICARCWRALSAAAWLWCPSRSRWTPVRLRGGWC